MVSHLSRGAAGGRRGGARPDVGAGDAGRRPARGRAGRRRPICPVGRSERQDPANAAVDAQQRPHVAAGQLSHRQDVVRPDGAGAVRRLQRRQWPHLRAVRGRRGVAPLCAPHGHPHAAPYIHADRDRHTAPDGHRHPNCDADAHRHRVPDRDGHAHANGHTDRDPDRNRPARARLSAGRAAPGGRAGRMAAPQHLVSAARRLAGDGRLGRRALSAGSGPGHPGAGPRGRGSAGRHRARPLSPGYARQPLDEVQRPARVADRGVAVRRGSRPLDRAGGRAGADLGQPRRWAKLGARRCGAARPRCRPAAVDLQRRRAAAHGHGARRPLRDLGALLRPRRGLDRGRHDPGRCHRLPARRPGGQLRGELPRRQPPGAGRQQRRRALPLARAMGGGPGRLGICGGLRARRLSFAPGPRDPQPGGSGHGRYAAPPVSAGGRRPRRLRLVAGRLPRGRPALGRAGAAGRRGGAAHLRTGRVRADGADAQRCALCPRARPGDRTGGLAAGHGRAAVDGVPGHPHEF